MGQSKVIQHKPNSLVKERRKKKKAFQFPLQIPQSLSLCFVNPSKSKVRVRKTKSERQGRKRERKIKRNAPQRKIYPSPKVWPSVPTLKPNFLACRLSGVLLRRDFFFVMNARIIRAAGTNILFRFEFSFRTVITIACGQDKRRLTVTVWGFVVGKYQIVKMRNFQELGTLRTPFPVKWIKNSGGKTNEIRKDGWSSLVTDVTPLVWGWWKGGYQTSWVVIRVLQEQEGVRLIHGLQN